MTDLTTFAIAAFAVYRLARMLADEDGPFDLLSRLRSSIDPDQHTWVGRGLNCPLCVGFWLALPTAILVARTAWPLWWPALAGASDWLHKQER